ncbi:MAG: hypothetical protein QNK04_20450 [Myxococcota bacterium]|nr:hypothetical protein [Myxococcota bacterium]
MKVLLHNENAPDPQYYLVIKGNWHPGKNINDFLQWFGKYREEQRSWGVTSAQVMCAWFGGTHHLTCIYGVESLDRWNRGVDSPTGLQAIFAVCDVLDPKSLQFEVAKEIAVDF